MDPEGAAGIYRLKLTYGYTFALAMSGFMVEHKSSQNLLECYHMPETAIDFFFFPYAAQLLDKWTGYCAMDWSSKPSCFC